MQSLLYWFKWLLTKELPAGSILGVPLRLHLLLAIILPFIAVGYARAFGPTLGWGWGIGLAGFFLLALYASVVAHEFGHAWGNRLVGGKTDRIIIWPLGGLAVGYGAEQSPRTELLVTALGPAVSIALALLGGLALWGADAVFAASPSMPLLALYVAVRMFMVVNIYLALFNLLLPLFPMDSARLLRAWLSRTRNPEAVTLGVCKLGLGIGIALLMAFFLRIELPFLGPISWILVLIGVFGIQSCLMEMERVRHMPVYTRSDNWSGRTVFLDGDTMGQAREKAREDLGKVLPGKGPRKAAGRVVKSAPVKGPAKVIDIGRGAPDEGIDELDDIIDLNRRMRAAAEAEDYVAAARIKARIRQVEESRKAGKP